MSDARTDILAAVKAATPGTDDEARQRLADHRAGAIPARGRLGDKARVDLFIREAERVNATVARASSMAGVPREVVRFLAKNNLPMNLKIAPDISGKPIPWNEQTLLSVEEGRAAGSETAGVSRAVAGVGVAGMLLGGNFLNYSLLADEPARGQHLGILLIELGVGMTVAAAMITIFFTFASQER